MSEGSNLNLLHQFDVISRIKGTTTTTAKEEEKEEEDDKRDAFMRLSPFCNVLSMFMALVTLQYLLDWRR
jgi:hypothetical protein